MKKELKKENISSINKIIKIIQKIINEEYSDLNNEIDYFRLNALNDTSHSIEFIPNKLLCTLANEIIKVTAIKQKISSEDEYMSIKSHISLVTKSNGFKWVEFDDEII